MQRLFARVYGTVQGVGFRAFVQRRAVQLGLTGYVRNLWDEETVEVVAEGMRPLLDELLAAIHRGPSMARVERVEVEWRPASGEYHHFRIRE